MKAIVIHEYGPPDVLRYQDLPDPVPRQGEIRIKVHAATVNRVLDVSLRAGREQYRGPVLPLIPGVDCAGIVDAVGPQVSRWHVGDRVSAAGIMPLQICAEDGSGYDGPQGMMGIKRPGGFAELVAVPACAGVAIPQNLDFHRAAVVMRHVPTAWNLLMHVAELKYGETVLIMGAGGNLGSIGIQIAKNVIGAHVIAAAGSEERAALGKKLGADHAHQLHDARHLRRGDEDHRRQRRRRALRQHRQSQGAADRVSRHRHGRPPGHRGRACRAERVDRFLAPLSQAHHHKGPARLHAIRPAALP